MGEMHLRISESFSSTPVLAFSFPPFKHTIFKKIYLILMALFTSVRSIFSVFGFVFVVKVPRAQCSDSVGVCVGLI